MKIALLEDNIDFAETIVEWLQEAGFAGGEALAASSLVCYVGIAAAALVSRSVRAPRFIPAACSASTSAEPSG